MDELGKPSKERYPHLGYIVSMPSLLVVVQFPLYSLGSVPEL